MNPQASPTDVAAAMPAHLPAAMVLLDAIAGMSHTNPAHVIGACVQIACDFGHHLQLHDEVAALLRACAGELQAEAAAANRTLQ